MRRDRIVRFGLNYTPGKRWYYIWNDWDLSEVEADFRAMASLGIDHIRLQLIWPWFQPNPSWVSPGHLARLQELLRVAHDSSIDVQITLLTGFLSGYTFLPSRVRPLDVFTAGSVFQAEVDYARRVLDAVRESPAFLGFDLGNEMNCLAPYMAASLGDRWARRFMHDVGPLPPGCDYVNGVDHFPWMSGTAFSPAHLATDYPWICLHAWPEFTGCRREGGLSDPPSLRLAEFCARWARLFAPAPGKQVWLQEFGCSSVWGPPREQETYLRETIQHALRAGVTRFTFWCSHDKLADIKFHPYEYHYGLFSADNWPKPLAAVYREIIAETTALPAPTAPTTVLSVPDDYQPAWTDLTRPDDWLDVALRTDFWKAYRAFLAKAAGGAEVALLRSSWVPAGTSSRDIHALQF